MRNIRFVVLVVVALASTASIAGAQSGSRAPSHAGRAMTHRGGGGKALLRGVSLSTDEKAKLEEIRGRYREQGRTLHQSLKPAMQEAVAARQKGDTAAARALFERTKGDRDKLKALRQRQLSDVRGALSSEHQRQFDANLKQAAEQRASAKKGSGGTGHRRGRGTAVRPATNG